jgi:hypothetical protein
MFHGDLYYFQKPPLEGRPNTKLGTIALQTLTTIDLYHHIIMCEDLHELK